MKKNKNKIPVWGKIVLIMTFTILVIIGGKSWIHILSTK